MEIKYIKSAARLLDRVCMTPSFNPKIFGVLNAYTVMDFRLCTTVVPKDYWDKKNLQDMGPLSVNSIHIRGLLFEKNQIF